MNTLKTFCVAAILSAAAYGVYMAVTVSPPADPPPGTTEIAEEGLHVSVPDADDSKAATRAVATSESEAPKTKRTSSKAKSRGAAPAFAPEAPANSGPKEDLARDGNRIEPDRAERDRIDPDPIEQDPIELDPNAIDERDSLAEDRIELYPTSRSRESDSAEESADLDSRSSADSNRDRNADSDAEIGLDERLDPDDLEDTSREADLAANLPPRGELEAQPPVDFERDWMAAESLLNRGKQAEALTALSTWYGDPSLSRKEERMLLEKLDELAGAVIYSGDDTLDRPHEVAPGESLEDIARENGVSRELLAKINSLRDPELIRVGDSLKVPRGPFDAEVDLDRRQLTLWLGNRYAGRFPIELGKSGGTEGKFSVRKKAVNPRYDGPDASLDADDPANPLGELALDLGNDVYIHTQVDTGGLAPTAEGSIGLRREDIEDVFDILVVGSKVTIRR